MGRALAFWTRRRVLVFVLLSATYAAFVRLALRSELAQTIVWSAAMLLSFIGWGELVNLWLSPKRLADWALRAVWGLSLTLLAGGALTALHLTSRPVLIGQVLLGVAIFTARRVILPAPRVRKRERVLLFASLGPAFVLGVAYLYGALQFLAMAGQQIFQASDDYGLYFTLVQKVLQQGSMVDPFDVRRLSTFGGQIYLEAQFVAVAPMYFLNALDTGLFGIVLMGLIGGMFTSRGLRPAHVVPLGAALLLVVFLLTVRLNTASLMSAAAMHFGLYRTLHFSPARGADRRPRWPIEQPLLCVLALLTVTCFVLRTSNAIPVCLFMAILLVASYVTGERKPLSRGALRTFLRAGLLFTGVFLAALLPWSIALRESCGTFFYPALGKGTMTPGFVFLKSVADVREAGDILAQNLFYDRPFASFPLLAVAGLALMPGRWRFDLLAMTLGTLIGATILILMGAGFLPDQLARYYFAYVTGTAIAVVASVGQRAPKSGRVFSGVRDMLALGAVAYHVGVAREPIRAQFTEYVKAADRVYTTGANDPAGWHEKSRQYAELQSHMAPGARAVTAVEEAFRFDLARNRIDSLDIPGGMGPKPGFPVFQGPDALDSYLRAQGVRYIVYVDFDKANELYNKAHWEKHVHWTAVYLSGEAPYMLDTVANILELSKRKAHVYEGGGMTLLDLDAPR
jgi:hypothetical protein